MRRRNGWRCPRRTASACLLVALVPSARASAAAAATASASPSGRSLGLALKRSMQRAQLAQQSQSDVEVDLIRSAAEKDCAALVDEDLKHVALRASASCYAKARDVYCDKVIRSEVSAQKPTLLGRPEDLCPTDGSFNDIDVQMQLRSPGQASVAYLILAYDKFDQVKRLVSRLHDPDRTLIVVHLDQKVASSDLMDQFRSWAKKFKQRVKIFSEFAVHRGGRSMLDVQLRAFELLLDDPVAWDYYINLSDTHYPSESALWIGSYLWLHNGTNYARITSTKYYDPTLQGGKGASYDGPRREDLFVACDRSLAFECDGKLFSLSPGVKYPSILSGVTAASGPEWVILSRSFVDYVRQGLLPSPEPSPVKLIYDDLAYLSIPEETFFQTLLLSSPFCKSVLRHEFLYLDLYNAPWRSSPNSDFPFQSPRALNATHLAEIARDDPWFVRKVDDEKSASRSFRQSLDTSRERRSAWGPAAIQNHRRSAWASVETPYAIQLALHNLIREGSRSSIKASSGDHIGGINGRSNSISNASSSNIIASNKAWRWIRPVQLNSAHLAPWVLDVLLKSACSSTGREAPLKLFTRKRGCAVQGYFRITERLAVPDLAQLAFRGDAAPIVSLRIGCSWHEAAYEFQGEVSVVSGKTCGTLSLVAYVNNIGFEGEVVIHWLHQDRLMRQSGGQIPKGYTMFVDRMKPQPFGHLSGRWYAKILESKSGRTLASRSFLVYSNEEPPSSSDLREFFDFGS
eukprot:TRINITY_DN27814_c0_g1_i1.p1 TRINITY_DN27814_c0_g1~~TRINITY_DN27814_c0_g1_i1.p1  ORF type:complete len:743 (-),score=74.10 TRINITY_DN27814_c0_g1_i1:21-2249(-)